MVFILIHDTIDADMRHLGRQGGLEELAETLGELSLYGLLILVVISIATFVPYHLWRWTHRLMGFFFVAGAAHYLFILKPFANGDPIGLYTSAFCIVGILAFSYRLLPAGMRPTKNYSVESIEQTGNSIAVTMAPKSGALRHRAGQFAFASFEGAEPHPFTISNAPSDDGKIRMTIARLGDYTNRLHRNLKVGTKLKLEGPYGHFERRPSAKSELWIGAGIGITPFLAWAQAKTDDSDVHLIYCVKSDKDAAHLAEIEALAKDRPNLNLMIHQSSSMGRASAVSIMKLTGVEGSNTTVAFCGPKPMRQALIEGFKMHGITGRNFKYEEFEIRTGIGLKKLAAILFERAAASRIVQERLKQ
jgi:predicted ferric reductase